MLPVNEAQIVVRPVHDLLEFLPLSLSVMLTWKWPWHTSSSRGSCSVFFWVPPSKWCTKALTFHKSVLSYNCVNRIMNLFAQNNSWKQDKKYTYITFYWDQIICTSSHFQNKCREQRDGQTYCSTACCTYTPFIYIKTKPKFHSFCKELFLKIISIQTASLSRHMKVITCTLICFQSRGRCQ